MAQQNADIGRSGTTLHDAKCGSNPITKKVAKILDSKIETDKEVIDALNTVSTFFDKNTLPNRRNLRRDIEHFSLQVNLEFLENFKKVKEELDKVSTSVAAMNSCCVDMSNRLQATKSQTRDLIEQTTKLRGATKNVERRKEVAGIFLSIFQLKPGEIRSLEAASEGIITKEFFDALRRTKEIHADCRQLLLHGQHTAGLEIMDMMSTRQETAYEMLYRWIQKESETFNADKADISDLLSQALGALEVRPVLFKYSLDECCNARRNYIIRLFLNALTKGSTTGVPKPIELLSHDSLRYVNDMLAWIHQGLASEKEFMQQLLKDCAEETRSKYITSALTLITEGLSRPFKVRVEQVLGGENGPVVLYKLSNLFRFYYGTISPCLEEDAPLLLVINDLFDLLIGLFKTSLAVSLNKILEKMEPPDQELLPAQSVHQVLLLLKDVLEAHDVTLSPMSDKKESFARIFSTVVDSLLNALLVTCTDLNAIDLAVYMLNCLNVISSVLSLYEYTEERLEMLQAQVDVHVSVLISEQAGFILQRTGVSEIYNMFVQLRSNQGPASKIPGLDALSLMQSFEKFNLFLLNPDSYKLPQCQMISSPKIKQSVDYGTLEAVVAACCLIRGKMEDPFNEYSESLSGLIEQLKNIDDILLK